MIAVYMRVSTDVQRDKHTIENQRDFIQAHCDSHNLKIGEFFADEGVSGTEPMKNRPEGKKLFQAAREGRISRLLMVTLDRFGRGGEQDLMDLRELEGYGVQVQFLRENFDDTPAGQLSRRLMSSISAFERDVIRQRTVDGSRRLLLIRLFQQATICCGGRHLTFSTDLWRR